jgi:tRNA dimethylallyltransferase
MPPTERPIILILGPTAGGKTALSIELATRLGGECICADSMQVYRGLDIGTAKPTAAEQLAAPHHLLDIAEPDDEHFSVDLWLELTEQAINEIRSRGHWPIVVGGTNLYIQALLFGLFEGPPPDTGLRERLQRLPLEELRLWLERIDPDAAARIHPNDRKRTIRAIEVHETTGRPISEQQTQWSPERIRTDMIIIGLEYPVDVINRRINARVRAMIETGLVEEVRQLHEAGRLGRQAAEALGYKQIIDHLRGRCSLEEAVEEIKIRTRRFAKQQRTWLRRFRTLNRSIWLDATEKSAKELAELADSFIQETLEARPADGRSSTRTTG